MDISGCKENWEMRSLLQLAMGPAKNRVPITEKEEKDKYWGITTTVVVLIVRRLYTHLKNKRVFVSLHTCHNYNY